MNFIVIDTSCDSLTIAIKKGDELYGYKSEENRKGHSTVLLPSLNDLLNKAELTLDDIDYFGAVVGPGSFTGVRVGVSTVNAFGYATKKPVIGVTAFEPFSYNMCEGSSLAIDAKHAYYIAEMRSGELVYRTDEAHEIGEAKLIDPNSLTPDMLATVMEKKIALGKAEDAIKPFYMRASEAERNLKK